SGCSHPQLGRNYMIHLSPIAGGLFRQPTGADETFVKQVGFADYYLGGTAYPHKLGLIQSLPAPGPLMLRKTLPRFIPQRLLPFLRRHLLPLAGIVEDLPSRGNRVTPADGGKISVTHQFTAYDLERGQRMLRWMKQILRCAGALFSVGFATPPRDHVAHQCGTARFGSSERVAPVAPDCRVFGIPNLFIVDGSIFPTSLGVGPALTIAANALRVARIVVGEA
ncbi:MAG TPA: GMC family oxidoreductase, partial [Pirellulaceae bacterium]|nr:GMC family oxidoreductase [Pirellulaceae bacterium]